MHPPTRFLTTKDGVNIAYATQGEGTPLVFVFGWVSHLEMMWEDPGFRSYFETLGRQFKLVRYDARGNGLSDREIEEVDLEGLILDLESLVEELALTDIILYGATFGGPIVIAYAARHPERVSKLILDGTYARGRETGAPEQHQAIISALSRLGPAAFYMLGVMTQPEPDQLLQRRVARAARAISRDVAVQLYSLGYAIDVADLLPQIRAPTLVLHRRGSQAIPFELGRKLASSIPKARFVALEGTAHNPWQGDPSPALAAIADFLNAKLEVEPAPRRQREKAPLTILFTDMESSTALTQRLGDAMAQELLRTHNTIVRRALRMHGGSEIKHTGDGIMASLPSASQGLECAVEIQRAVAAHAGQRAGVLLRVRIGLNAGEPVAEEQDLFGTAVQLARRICDCAEPGQILVSNVVRELVAGKGFLFSDEGDVALRGFEDPVRLYGVRWQGED